MPTNTAKTYLFYDSDGQGTMEKLVDIIDYPDMGATPTKIDVTTLSDDIHTKSIFGLQDLPDLTFTANYDKTTYELIESLTGEQKFELHFGENGVNGKFTWNGEIRVFALGGGVNEARKMQITVSATTTIIES